MSFLILSFSLKTKPFKSREFAFSCQRVDWRKKEEIEIHRGTDRQDSWRATDYWLLDPLQNAQHLDKGAYTSGCEII
jgi:hypothetical protein